MEGSASFRVMTWNLLAPIFTRPNPDDPSDFAFFAHASEAVLAWEGRRALLEARLDAERPDVLAAQEVELERDETGKGWVVPRWLSRRFGGWALPELSEAEWEHQRERNERVLKRGGVTSVALLWGEGMEMEKSSSASRGLAGLFKRRNGERRFVVCCVHLEGNPELGEMRAKQLKSAMRAVRKSSAKWPGTPVVVMGDFNANLSEVEPNAKEEGLTVCKLTRPTWSDSKKHEAIDHVLVSPGAKLQGSVHEFFTEYDAEKGLPNDRTGSDHAPLLATFEFVDEKTEPAVEKELSKERKEEITKMWDAVEKVEKSKGKPTPQQMEMLKAFATRKKAFVAQFTDEAEAAFARGLAK